MKYIHPNHTNTENGFTIVETVVTLVIVTLFLIGFFQSYMLLESQRISVARQAKASDIAYSNLRKVTSRTGISCDSGGYNLISSGYVVMPQSDLEKALGKGASQTLTAYPTAGCSGTAFSDNPVQIVSKVTHTNGLEATHASFVQ